MAVAVNKQVDAVDVGSHIDGAVGLAALVHAQVAQADDEVAPGGLQLVHLLLGTLIELLALQELQALHILGIGLGSGLGGGQAEHADLLAALQFKDLVGLEDGLAGALVHQVGTQDGELSLVGQFLQVVPAVVELMVAGAHGVIARGIHELDGRGALVQVDQRVALDGVAGGEEQDRGAGRLEVLLQLGHAGGADALLTGCVAAVGVVGMQDDYLARHAVASLGHLHCHGGSDQADGHGQRQEQGKELACAFHSNIPPFVSSYPG